MALEKQVIPYLFGSLDTKTDERALTPPALTLLENTRRTKNGRIDKRLGNKPLGINVVGSSLQLEDPDALAVFENELLQFHKQSMYSYGASAERSVLKGSYVGLSVSCRDIIHNNYEQTQVSSATEGDVTLLAWEDSRGGVRATVYDNATGTALVSDEELNSSATMPQCIAWGSYLYVIYLDGTDLIGRQIAPKNPSPLGSEVTITSGASAADPAFDICSQNTHLLVAYNYAGGAEIRIHRLNEALAVQQSATIAEDADNALALVQGYQSTFVLWHNATGVRVAAYNLFLTQTVAPATVEAVADVIRITGYKLPDESGVRVFYEVTAAASYNHLIRTVTITNAGPVGTPAVLAKSVGIASKAWSHSPDTTERGFLTVVHSSTLQSTFFVLKHDGSVAARFKAGLAGGLLSRNLPAAVSYRSSGVYQVATLTKGYVVSAGDKTFLTFRGVTLTTLDFTDENAFQAAELGGCCLLAGGIVAHYDSEQLAEHGFLLYPENVSAAAGSGGSLTSSSTYSFKVCYEWTDGRNKVHRSAPSVAVTVALGAGENRVTLTVPTLRLTEKADVSIVAYRTEADGLTYYRSSSPTSLTFNSKTADTVTIVDDLADSTLISRELLYTTGDVLENLAPPSAALIMATPTRVVIKAGDEDRLWVSKEVREGEPIQFSDYLTINIDRSGGDTTALAEIDGVYVVFKEEQIIVVTGDGPNDLGVGGQFSTPKTISADTGCINARSVVEVPDGLMFKSEKGIYLLTRDFTVSYIGAPVEEWNDETITSAVKVPTHNEVRFSTDGGPTLVYNYFFKEWHVWPNATVKDAVLWQKQYVSIRERVGSPALCVCEEPDFFQDIDQAYSMRIGLAWAPLMGFQAFQRIWRVLFLGAYRSPHKLKLFVSYNYSDVISDEYLFDPVEAMDLEEYGDGAYYGADSVYGGSGKEAAYQVRVHLTQQKCEAVQFILEDLPEGGSYESCSWNGISFEVGAKKGAFKLPAERSL